MINRIATIIAVTGLVFAAIFSSPAFAKDKGSAPYGGPKKSVTVIGFEAPELVQGGATAEELMALLVNALVKDGRFVVVERVAMPDIQAEQQLGQAGGITAETAAKPGQFLGASAIVRGTVTKFEAGTGGGTIGVSGLPFLGGGGLGVTSQTAMVEISLRVIDTTTSQIIYTGTAKGHASSREVQVTPGTSGLSWNGGAFMKTPLGEALQDAIDKSVDQIAAAMAKVPWSALVIDCDGTNVYITAGADQGIMPGTTFHIFRKAKELTDPATGVVLDVMMEDVGTIQIESVRDKISIATISSGNPPARGDVVKMY